MEGPAVKRPKLFPTSSDPEWSQWGRNLEVLQEKILSGCLCHMETLELHRPLLNSYFPSDYTLEFMSTIELLISVAINQNGKGSICSKLKSMATSVSMDEEIWGMLLVSLNSQNKFISRATSKCLRSLFLWTKLPNIQDIFDELLKEICESLQSADTNPFKLNSTIEILRGIVEFKDEDEHPLEEIPEEPLPLNLPQIDNNSQNLAGPSGTSNYRANCSGVNFNNSEVKQGVNCSKIEVDLEFEYEVKTHCIKALESWWTRLCIKFKSCLTHFNPSLESSIVSFFSLWQSLISVRANLSVVDTKHFYMDVESFVPFLNSALPATLWKKVLDVFNEILCYGSTLSLQDVLADEPCNLAHLVIRGVKSRQFLQGVPFAKKFTGFGGHSFGPVDWQRESELQISRQATENKHGSLDAPNSLSCQRFTPNPITSVVYIGSSADALELEEDFGSGDRPLLQKVTLLVLKCVAVTVKETRSDADDSSGGSDDSGESSSSESDTNDMIIIERSMREVFQVLDDYVKSLVPFHPATPLGEWIVKLFSDQDDALVEAMLCTLDTFTGFFGRIKTSPDFYRNLNPVVTFMAFSATVSDDKDTFLDLLMSNETSFLLYLLRFLKFAWKNWGSFISTCGRDLDNMMTLLIRLKISVERLVEKALFPYNINPVLRLLERIEDHYETNSQNTI